MENKQFLMIMVIILLQTTKLIIYSIKWLVVNLFLTANSLTIHKEDK